MSGQISQRLALSGPCHLAALLLWMSSGHAAAIPSLLFPNYQNDVICHPAHIEKPKSTQDVVQLVQKALANGQKVKAATSRFASSNTNSCVDQGGIQIDTSGMDQILEVDTSRRRVTVQPGIKLWDLNQILHRHYGLTLPVVQEYGEVTIGGMIGNSTHGSSLQEFTSSVQDRIMRAQLVDGHGTLRTFEGPELDFVSSNLGVLGIVTSVTLQVEPTFKVQAITEHFSDQSLETEILPIAASGYSVSVTWFPMQKSYIISRYQKVPNETPGEDHNGQMEVFWWKRKIFPYFLKVATASASDHLMCFLEKQRFEMKAEGYYTDRFAHLAKNPVGWSHEMINFVCRDRCPLETFPTSLQEVAVPLARLPQLLTRIRALMEKNPTCLPLNGIYIRFGQPTRGAISLAQGRASAYVGVEYVPNQQGNRYPKGFESVQEIEQMMIHEFEGRPSWGKNFQETFRTVRDQYPRFDEFIAFRDSMDPERMFENTFFRNLRDKGAGQSLTPNCVALEGCYCEEDIHCPRGSQCMPGVTTPTAKVCLKGR